jgi:hypothetical protein
MAEPSPAGAQGRRDLAVDFCRDRIRHYARLKVVAFLGYYFFQTGVIVLSAVTPLLVLEDVGSALFRAAPAAIAGVFAALSTVYHTRENWLRCTEMEDELTQELLLFQTEASPLYGANVPDARALSNFVHAIERIMDRDTSRWRALFDDQAGAGSNEGDESPQRGDRVAGA